MKENRGAVLRSVVRPLAVELGRVVTLKEGSEQLAIGNLFWIEFDLDCLGVARLVSADLLVARITGVDADIANCR